MTDGPGEPGTSFAGLGLRAELLGALSELGYEEPTRIQAAAVPPLLAGRDLIGQAATGTGKTAAFALPALQMLAVGGGAGGPAGLVLVPTRELAVQVCQAVHRYGRGLGARVVPIYGGQPIGRQLRALDAGVDVVVATPGRALDHVGRGTLALGDLRLLVLDEADEMLDMGFAEDIEAILAAAPADRQTVLFSATIPARIDGIARRHLHDPVRIRIDDGEPSAGGVPLVRQRAHLVQRAHKPAALGRVLDIEAPAAALVFCRTRDEVDSLAEILNGRGYRAEALHGGMSQEQRDRVMGRLRSGSAELLLATDVAARGLDIDQLSHVVNYDVPASADSYVHRIGRVGRAGREGVAITLAEPREHRMLKTIERATGRKIPVEKIPTVADLAARRMELTRAALRECLSEDDLDSYRVVVESLADEFEVMEIALAAVKLANRATSATAPPEGEIPEPPVRPTPAPAPPGRRVVDQGAMARLWIGAGREAGIRPQDLVGAITGEAGLAGREVGAIDISARFSLVDVPETSAEAVIVALRRTSIKGRRPAVRRDIDRSGGARQARPRDIDRSGGARPARRPGPDRHR